MHALIIATRATPSRAVASGISDNSPHGFNWTFAFPMILFVVVAAVLYLVYTRPHKVPGHGELRFTRETTTPAGSLPDPESARAAAVAAGFSTAAGGGDAESVAEAAGAYRVHSEDELSGNVSQDENPAPGSPGDTAVPEADEPSAADQPASIDPASTDPASTDPASTDPEASE